MGSAVPTNERLLFMKRRPLLLAAALAAPSVAGSSSTCVERVEDLPYRGICPPTELVCPACPPATPYKCPSGGCTADVRTCTPNVWLKGECDETTCKEVRRQTAHAAPDARVHAARRAWCNLTCCVCVLQQSARRVATGELVPHTAPQGVRLLGAGAISGGGRPYLHGARRGPL